MPAKKPTKGARADEGKWTKREAGGDRWGKWSETDELIGTVKCVRTVPKYKKPNETETVMDFVEDGADDVVTYSVPRRLGTLLGTIQDFPARVKIVNLGIQDGRDWRDFELYTEA